MNIQKKQQYAQAYNHSFGHLKAQVVFVAITSLTEQSSH